MSVKSNKEYEVENILKNEWLMRKLTILSSKKEYNISENTWKSRENLKNCMRAL
jgi:hypothetical protein